jgi:anhydro-N-acetylmuramic acid kinase
MSALFIGVMSGTSVDGVDAVLVDFANGMHTLGHCSVPFDAALRQHFLSLNQPGGNELHVSALAGNQLALVYAQTVHDLLNATGLQPRDISAIGAHGQTVRHQPGLHDGIGYTLQINNPSLLAERTGIRVVADFRSRDLAAGGQGAPLVPAFHQHVFGESGKTVAVLNIGGMSNISLLRTNQVIGFDCGPGNVLLDHWCQLHTGQLFDRDGAWAAQGRLNQPLLEHMMQEAFFQLPFPKSTGRDLFHADWLNAHLHACPPVNPVDVQTTLTALTAHVCANEVLRYSPDAVRLLVCGGGAYNRCLMAMLQQRLPDIAVQSTELYGLPPLQVEAAAFAWLARQTCLNLPGNLSEVTGARGPRVLGGIYPA